MSRKRLLVIEDDHDVAEMLLLYFGAHQYDVVHAETGREGVDLARARFPHLILLDVMLPDMDGYEVCHTVRQTSFTRYIPIIFLTQRDERANKVKGLALGADDYVTKPFDIDELRLRIQSAIHRATRESLHEARTGLPTGQLVDDELQRRRTMNVPFTQMVLTVENFKPYSEVYGFMASDEVFSFTARAIQQVISTSGTPDDFVGITEDRFVVLTHAPDCTPLISEIQGIFQEGVKAFYSFKDVEKGGLVLNAGTGEQETVPLMQLHVAP